MEFLKMSQYAQEGLKKIKKPKRAKRKQKLK